MENSTFTIVIILCCLGIVLYLALGGWLFRKYYWEQYIQTPPGQPTSEGQAAGEAIILVFGIPLILIWPVSLPLQCWIESCVDMRYFMGGNNSNWSKGLTVTSASTQEPALRSPLRCMFRHQPEQRGDWDNWVCARCDAPVPYGCVCGLHHRPGVCDGGR